MIKSLHQQDLNFGSKNKIEEGEMGSSDENKGFKKETSNINTEQAEGRRLKEEMISEALREISRGVPSRVAAKKFGLSRNLVARRVKQEDTSG